MAKREENLKKINSDLEKLSDEELEHVAGGICWETEYDSEFLNDMEIIDKTYKFGFFGEGWSEGSKAVDDGWAKMGIGCCTNYGGKNKYWMKGTGQKISRKEAYDYVAKKLDEVYDYRNYDSR